MADDDLAYRDATAQADYQRQMDDYNRQQNAYQNQRENYDARRDAARRRIIVVDLWTDTND